MPGQHNTPQGPEQLGVFVIQITVSQDVCIPEADLFRFIFPPLTARPVESALREALVKRAELSFGPVSANSEAILLKKGVNRVQRVFAPFKTGQAESRQLSKEIKELFGWVAPVPKKGHDEESLNFVAKVLMEQGDTVSNVISLANKMKRGCPGPPIKKRRIAIEAYELRLQNKKKWTWSKLTKEFCTCGAQLHDYKCQERLRREVGHLKRLLQKYQIALPQTPPEISPA